MLTNGGELDLILSLERFSCSSNSGVFYLSCVGSACLYLIYLISLHHFTHVRIICFIVQKVLHAQTMVLFARCACLY